MARRVGIRSKTIREISDKYVERGYDQYDLADEYEYCQPHISRIVNDKVGTIDYVLMAKYNAMISNVSPSMYEPAQAKTLRAKRTRLHSTKLNMKVVERIRRMYFGGEYTQMELAMLFNVNQSTISGIIRGIKWKRLR